MKQRQARILLPVDFILKTPIKLKTLLNLIILILIQIPIIIITIIKVRLTIYLIPVEV